MIRGELPKSFPASATLVKKLFEAAREPHSSLCRLRNASRRLIVRPRKRTASRKTARNNAYDYTELTKAPEKARVKPNPFEKDPDASSRANSSLKITAPSVTEKQVSRKKGAQLYERRKSKTRLPARCSGCSPAVSRGKGMPVWSKLPEAQRWQIVR